MTTDYHAATNVILLSYSPVVCISEFWTIFVIIVPWWLIAALSIGAENEFHGGIVKSMGLLTREVGCRDKMSQAIPYFVPLVVITVSMKSRIIFTARKPNVSHRLAHHSTQSTCRRIVACIFANLICGSVSMDGHSLERVRR